MNTKVYWFTGFWMFTKKHTGTLISIWPGEFKTYGLIKVMTGKNSKQFKFVSVDIEKLITIEE